MTRAEWADVRRYVLTRDPLCSCGCGRPSVEVAHRISNSKVNRRKYGPYVIDHPLNLRGTAHGAAHNDAMLIDNKPEEIRALLEAIKAENRRKAGRRE